MVEECIRANGNAALEFQNDAGRCPRCKAEGYPSVLLLALTHLLVPDERGQIPSRGRRFSLACHKGRDYLATMTNKEAATGDVRQVNCPECLKNASKLKIKGSLVCGSVLTGESGAVL